MTMKAKVWIVITALVCFTLIAITVTVTALVSNNANADEYVRLVFQALTPTLAAIGAGLYIGTKQDDAKTALDSTRAHVEAAQQRIERIDRTINGYEATPPKAIEDIDKGKDDK